MQQSEVRCTSWKYAFVRELRLFVMLYRLKGLCIFIAHILNTNGREVNSRFEPLDARSNDIESSITLL